MTLSAMIAVLEMPLWPLCKGCAQPLDTKGSHKWTYHQECWKGLPCVCRNPGCIECQQLGIAHEWTDLVGPDDCKCGHNKEGHSRGLPSICKYCGCGEFRPCL